MAGTFTANSTGVIKTLTLNDKATLRPVEKEGRRYHRRFRAYSAPP
ncbi:hypothetical protein WSK_2526 [Novosphingobium sp. Rr 2-17]|nr:hypothetical protein WSK_2526 [Novosphingobium sp. Rr 2-17]